MKTAFVVSIVFIAFTALASAQSIGVDFNGEFRRPNNETNDSRQAHSPTYTGKGVLGETFTGISTAGKGIKVTDNITINLSTTGKEISFRDRWAKGCNDLLRDFVQTDRGQTLTVTIHGLMPQASYHLVAYVASNGSGIDAMKLTGALEGSTTGASWSGSPVSRKEFVTNQNYVWGKATADATGSITFTVANNRADGYAVLNGFGLAPELAVSL